MTLASPGEADITPALTLRDIGSFFVGGQTVETADAAVEQHVLARNGVPVRIDPNGTTWLGQMYVQYAIPAVSARLPVLFWHGGSLTGVTWETTPDGRQGWFNQFLRLGWPCYNVDAVERGRSGWAPRDPHFAAPAMLRTWQDSFTQFRIGRPVRDGSLASLAAAAYPNCRFPLDAFGAFMRQVVPRWSTTDDLAVDAYCRLLEQVGPAIIVAHSQGGAFAFRAAERCPGQVAAIVAIEPAQGGTTDGAALAGIPVLAVYGDHLNLDARWPTIRARTEHYFAAARAAGACIEVLDLPLQGIHGNSHMLMMERNNADIALLIHDWLQKRLPVRPDQEDPTHA
ncbi:esterase [Acidisphaera sp. L21]|uniref:esterase n=1 Tax=Acidisphaera sp. L21 TaxID=1641851 RepID=UPI001C20BEA4|nr:esterase [Acidisphaera sp. L21]